MGAIPYDGGVTFRTWTLFADSVAVAGEFNSWGQTPLVSEGGGLWSADVPVASAGQQYKFVVNQSGDVMWRKDPRGLAVTNSNGNSIIYDQTAFDWGDYSWSMAPWNEIILYEMHVGTFNDEPDGAPGTFTAALSRLDYLRDLGINAISLMPVCEFPGDYSWGYNPSDPFAVESAYGGPDALKTFIRECQARGIAVIVDVIFNHWGPGDLDLWRFDGWYENSGGGIYLYNDWRIQTPWGDTRPDYGRGAVRQYIRDNALMWLEEFRADGLRFDGTAFIRNVYGNNDDPPNDIPDGWSLMQWINDEINSRQGWKISVAEDMKSNHWITKATSDSGGAGFDTQWDPSFHHTTAHVMTRTSDGERSMSDLRDRISFRFNTDAFQRIIYTESHDEVNNGRMRKPEEIWPGNAGSWHSRKRSTLGAVLTFTSPGIPMIFMGQELLEDGYWDDDDPLDWSKTDTYAGINLLYRDLIRLRRNWFNNTRGLRGQHVNVFHVNDTDKVLAFHRWSDGGEGDDVVIVANWANRFWDHPDNYRIGLPRGGTWKVRLNTDSYYYGADYGNQGSVVVQGEAIPWNGMPYSGTVSIAPYSALILSQGPDPTPTPTPSPSPSPTSTPSGIPGWHLFEK